MNNIISIPIELKKKIFPHNNLSDIEYDKLQITKEGVYSVSKISGSKFLIKIINKHFNNNDNIVITDATSNVGSDTIMLAQTYKHINSIELDPVNYNVLKNNIQVYNLSNIDLYNANSIDLLDKLQQDCIYIDAPWGGSDYLQHESIKLYLDNKEISEIYNEFNKFCKIMIFKIPRNYDFTNFIQQTNMINKYNIYSFRKNDKIIYYLLVVNSQKN